MLTSQFTLFVFFLFVAVVRFACLDRNLNTEKKTNPQMSHIWRRSLTSSLVENKSKSDFYEKQLTWY